MDDTKESISSYWSENVCDFKKAPTFDELDERQYAIYPWVDEVFRMKEMAGMDVLEVGVGSACSPCKAIREYKPKTYTLYDISPGTLEVATNHLKEHCGDFPFKTIQGDMEDMSAIPDNSFDIVLAIGSIHHTTTPLRALKEISRVLKDNGKFVFMFYNKDSWRVKYKLPWAMKYGNTEVISIDEMVRKWDGITNPIGIALTRTEIKTAMRKAGFTITHMETRETSNSFNMVPLPKFLKNKLKKKYGDSMYVYGINKTKEFGFSRRLMRHIIRSLI